MKGVSLKIYYLVNQQIFTSRSKVDYILLMRAVLCYMELRLDQLKRRCDQTTEIEFTYDSKDYDVWLYRMIGRDFLANQMPKVQGGEVVLARIRLGKHGVK